MLHRLLALFLLCVSATAWAQAPRDPATYFFDQSLGDFQEELAVARDNGKTGILLFFELQDCPFCERMKETVLNQPEVQDYFKKHFAIYPVDIEGQVQIVDFQGNRLTEQEFAFEHNRVRATPVFLFVNLDGEPVARYTGATRDKQEFMWLGEYVVEEIYKEQSFTRYKRERRAERR